MQMSVLTPGDYLLLHKKVELYPGIARLDGS